MTTNEKIAKWLGMKRDKLEKSWWFKNNLGYILDFLHDRNQQKWIEDKLIEKYMIDSDYDIVTKKWTIEIYNSSYDVYSKGINQSKDLAFIQAVSELINKELELK